MLLTLLKQLKLKREMLLQVSKGNPPLDKLEKSPASPGKIDVSVRAGKFGQVHWAEAKGNRKVLSKMPRAIHAAPPMRAVPNAKKMRNLVNGCFA
eukprot:m.48823 g.48823  ORF g.48823 m.48823 type:complete len:95 (-) comp6446_c0_seq2:1373-1657(-)